MKEVEFCQVLFLYLLIWSYDFYLSFYECGVWHLLNHPCIPGINPTWSCHVILLMCSWIQFSNISLRIFFFAFFFFFGIHPQCMEVPRLGVESGLQPPAYATATAMPDPSCISKLHHSSWQCRIFNSLSNWTHIFMDPSQVHYCWDRTGTFFIENFCASILRDIGL